MGRSATVTWWSYEIDPQICRSCGACNAVCPTKAIQKPEQGPFWIQQVRCSKCGQCLESCRLRAITRRFSPKVRRQ